ncbi:MAG: hypothetical protein IKK21_02770 [Clostridia bacterium]|nr:hypothetical protein [Clostridia bacterium]
MTEHDRGRVVPFVLSPQRMRQSAVQRLKAGHPVEAIELYRRAAEADDRPESWLQLAHQLRLLRCPELAAKILRRAIARDRACAGTWLELAQCQLMLEESDGAVDCLYHALQEDPYDDEARELLCHLENAQTSREAFRMPGLVRRALAAWETGDRETALRRFRRGLKFARQKAPLYLTMGLLHIAAGDLPAGISCAARSLRYAPGDLQARLVIAAAAHEMGHRRLSRGLMARCMDDCTLPRQERMFLDITEKIGAAAARQEFLQKRLQRAPWRIPLLRALAEEKLLTGDETGARPLLNTILRLDPDDLRARAQLAYPAEPAGGGYPRQAVVRWLQLLRDRLVLGISPDELAAPATPLRDALDWCFSQPDAVLQEAALAGIAGMDSPQLRAYLREKLVSRHLAEDVRNAMLVRLAAMGDTAPKPVLVGQRMAMAQAADAAKTVRQQARFFLRTVLTDAGHSGYASQIVHFAARMWRVMTDAQRADAAGEGGYAYVKAVELLYLRSHGLTKMEAALRKDMMISPRRVQRVVRALALRAGYMKGEEP